MRLSVLLLLNAAVTFAHIHDHDHSIRTRFFNQPVNHFNPFDRRTFDMRFIQNTQFFQDGGPIFIFLTAEEGGGYGVYDDFIREGLIFEMANETNGLLFALEHRYFGVSRPTGDTSFDNLQWLNVHQVLADIARFIAHTKEFTFGAENSRVVLWGRGYAGSLAIWARQKYPNLIDIAWGSSSPLNAIPENSEALVNSYTTITNVGGPECAADIQVAMQMIEDMFDAGNTSYVEETLKLCDEMDHGNGYDLAALLLTLAEDSYQFIQRARYPEIDDKCTVIRGLDTPDDPPADPLAGFARWYINVLYPNIDCLDFRYATYVSTFIDPTWDSISTVDGRRQRMWLRCTQLGRFPVSAGGIGHPFGSRFEIDFFQRRCADIFGNDLFIDPWWMTDSIGRTNEHNGGLSPRAYRILMTQGELDPYRTLGPASDLNAQAPVILIHLESFSRDLGPLSDVDDYPHLQEVKGIIHETIHRWLIEAGGEVPTPPPPPTDPPPPAPAN